MSSNEFLSTYGGRNKNLPQTLTLDHVSPATRLLEKRRQMFEVQEALDAQKEEVSGRQQARAKPPSRSNSNTTQSALRILFNIGFSSHEGRMHSVDEKR